MIRVVIAKIRAACRCDGSIMALLFRAETLVAQYHLFAGKTLKDTRTQDRRFRNRNIDFWNRKTR